MADLVSPLFNLRFSALKLFHPFSARATAAGRWRRRRRGKQPQFVFFCRPISQDFVVISTHEHGDGSIIFRFGDPSEIVKEEELVEAEVEVEVEVDVEEEERKDGVVKVLDGDDEREVIVKNVEKNVMNGGLTDAIDNKISDSVVSKNEISSLVESDGIEQDERLCENSDHSVAEVSIPLEENSLEKDVEVEAKQDDRDLREISASEVSIPLEENSLEKDVEVEAKQDDQELSEISASEVSIPLEENSLEKDVEVEAKQDDRELSEISVSEVSTTNVVAPEEVSVENDLDEAPIPLTQEVDEESDSKDSEDILMEKEEEKSSAPLTDNVKAQAEEVDMESDDKFASVLDIKNVVPVEDIEVENDDEKALFSLTDNGITSVEVLEEQGNTEASDVSASQVLIEKKDESEEASMSSTDSLEVPEKQDDSELDDKLPETSVTAVHDSSGSEVVSANVIPMNGSEEASISSTDSLEVPEKQGDSESDDKLSETSVTVVNDSSGSEVVSENVVPMDESSVSLRDDSVSEQVQAVESSDDLTDFMIQSSSSDVDSSLNVTADRDHQETSEDSESIEHLSTDNVEQSSLKDSIKDIGETQIIDLSKDAEDQKTQMGIIEDEIVELSPPTEAEPILDEEVSHAIQELYDSDETQRALSLENDSSNVLPEVEQTEDVESSDAIETSSNGMVEVKSSGASMTSVGIQRIELVLTSGAAVLPHPSKALTGGEDAYFVATQSWLGVADGVCRWSLEGNYSGIYSRELMESCEKVILQCGDDPRTDPKEVLKLSVQNVVSSGSSTALIAHFDGQDLHVANIGDSGFMIIRNGVVHKKSSPMLHEFNFPMQIESGDDPSQIAEEYRVELDEGDIVVIGTDGLFDNLYIQEITSVVMKSLEANKTRQEIAEILAKKAQEVGSAAFGRSPFSDEAQAAGYVGHTGGKLDDVAVIVSLVQKQTC